MWHSGGSTDVRLKETGKWQGIPGLSLCVLLPEPASLRILYSMSVMPDQNFANDGEPYAINRQGILRATN